MGLYLGIDTSNYTTSAAFFDSSSGKVYSSRRLLPVKPGEKGLRQSDAVFHHTAALPERIQELCEQYPGSIALSAVAASDRPEDREGSYMPCFTVGTSFVKSLSQLEGIPLYFHSHQHGHIAAALYSADRMDILTDSFIAFHVSGGTTEAVLCEPDPQRIFTCKPLLKTSDLKAGQAIDRVGVMLGLPFPAGKALDRLSLESKEVFTPKISSKDGCPSLSGIENQCEKRYRDGAKPCDVARFCLDSIAAALRIMVDAVRKERPNCPVVFSGGVMSNTILREHMSSYIGTVFSSTEFSSDNAVGTALLAAIKDAMC